MFEKVSGKATKLRGDRPVPAVQSSKFGLVKTKQFGAISKIWGSQNHTKLPCLPQPFFAALCHWKLFLKVSDWQARHCGYNVESLFKVPIF